MTKSPNICEVCKLNKERVKIAIEQLEELCKRSIEQDDITTGWRAGLNEGISTIKHVFQYRKEQ